MAYENLDYTHLTPEQAKTVDGIVKAIRNKAYGIDVREAMARALEIVTNAISLGGGQESLQLSIRMSDLSQEVKLALTGGSVAVVGENSLGTEHIKNNAVTSDKTSFIKTSKNLIDASQAIYGYDFDENGNMIARDSYYVIPKMPVNPNTTVYKNKNGALVEYNASGSKIMSYANSGRRSYQLTSDTHFVGLSVSSSNISSAQLEYGNTETPYEEFKHDRLDMEIKMGVGNMENNDLSEISNFVKKDLLSGNQPELEHGDVTTSLQKGTDTILRARPKNLPLEMKSGEYVQILNTDKYQMAIATEDNPGRFLDGWNSTAYTATKDIMVAFMFSLKDGGAVDIEDLKENIYFHSNAAVATIADIKSGDGGAKYVTLSGSDENSGNSTSEGYATLQKALDENPSKIIIENGDYFQSATKSNVKDLTIMPLNPQGAPVRILGGREMKTLTAYNSIYYFNYSEQNTYYTNVFVNKTQPPIQNASRPMYYANLWEVGNEQDYNMKPVLTLSECENEVGTFYFNGSRVYLNPKNRNNTFVPVRLETGLTISGDKVTFLPKIEARYFDKDPLDLNYIRELSAIGVVGSHSARADGVSLDNTSGTLDKCEARFNTNDGFNLHFYGETTLIDCIGSDNRDDGVSHHEFCVGTIIGGKYERNGSGGVTPANNARVTTTGAIIRGNGIGISQNVNQDVETISKHNLITGNDIGVVSNSKGHFMSIGDVIQDNVTNVQGTLERY